MIKNCPICQKDFEFDNFKYRKYCSLKCRRKFRIIYQNLRSKEYRKKHKLQIKKWKLTHKDYFKKYREEHRIELRIKNRKYYITHKQQIKKYRKLYKNRKNQQDKIRRKVNISFKILCNLRIRIWKVLKGINKSNSTIKLLGCSINQLKQHLEQQFTKGMSWKNYGRWHIDHIKPCVSFDLNKVDEQKKCFNYKNLQPLWARDNLSKYDN